MTKEIDFVCPVVEVRPLTQGGSDERTDQRLITFHCPTIAETAEPGQFVALSCKQFLRRPLGIAKVEKAAGTFAVGGRAKGKGMADILSLSPGDEVTILGPLGHGYELQGFTNYIVVGGGTGVYPMLFLLETLKEQGAKTYAAFGFRDAASAILLDEFRAAADRCVVASEAEDLDVGGTVLAALTEIVQELSDEEKSQTCVLTCGPAPMMQAVAACAKYNGMSCQVSLEERMACGVGLCLTCVCKTKDESKEHGWHHTRCCKEGPVYPAEKVVWQ